jgi:serine protease Do
VKSAKPACVLGLSIIAAIVAVILAADGRAARAASEPPPAVARSAAESVYAAAPPRLLQIRTLVADAGRQTSIGSGFLVSADGFAITNYHVVSQVALEPKTYRLEYVAADGSRGDATLLNVDLANDLAVVRLDKRDAPFFTFDEAAMAGSLAKGEQLYSLGNPLDLGFTVNQGTYNGLVGRSYNERLHFTGAMNAGMSGGPAVTAEGRVVGVNVAKRAGGELVNFLVPARFAAALLQRAREQEPVADFGNEISRQVVAWQAGLYKSFGEDGFRPTALGPYQAPETAAAWFTCWAQTNAGNIPRPRASVKSTNCRSETGLYVAGDLHTGVIQLSHSYVSTAELNQFQFASFLTQLSQQRSMSGTSRKWFTPERCHEDFVSAAGTARHPPLSVVWCARAHRKFEGLYDVSLTAVTEDHGIEALVSRLSLQAVAYDDAVALSKRFLEAVQAGK